MTTLLHAITRSPHVLLLLALLWGTIASANEPPVASLQATNSTRSDQPRRDGPWLIDRDEQTGIRIRTMEMTLHPKAEPRPALKYRLIPDDFDMLDGNAALYYLKAEGFLEQDFARDRLLKVARQAVEKAQKEDKQLSEVPPFSWQTMTYDELPLQEVKEHLNLTAFQPFFLAEAAKRRRFELDRDIKNVDDPIGYLLPEIQVMRELSRTQRLRCMVALAEDRIDDAIAIIGQQYALASHLGQDGFFVTALTGVAIARNTWSDADALTLAQHADAPNLYWAYASLPRPLVNISHSLSVERQFLYMQVKALREVDETPRPVGYWKDFVDRVAVQIGSLASELGMTSEDPETNRAMLVGYIAAAYPGAKRYLIEEYDFSQEKIEAYPTAQVVFLAMVRYYETVRDDYFKWSKLPYWQAKSRLDSARSNVELASEAKQLGWAATPANALLPAFLVVQTASASSEQAIALLQTVEAIRMYGAAHNSKLPPTLDDLPVPAPMEPFTGQPLDYEYHQSFAVLTGHKLPGLQYRLILRFAK